MSLEAKSFEVGVKEENKIKREGIRNLGSKEGKKSKKKAEAKINTNNKKTKTKGVGLTLPLGPGCPSNLCPSDQALGAPLVPRAKGLT